MGRELCEGDTEPLLSLRAIFIAPETYARINDKWTAHCAPGEAVCNEQSTEQSTNQIVPRAVAKTAEDSITCTFDRASFGVTCLTISGIFHYLYRRWLFCIASRR